MKHTVEITNNPLVERIDLRTAKTLAVNCGWRSEYIEAVRGMLATHGYAPELSADHSLRHGGVIIGPIFYRLAWGNTNGSAPQGNTTMAYGARVCTQFRAIMSPVMNWAHANCEVEPILDKDGLHFFNDDDFLLYTMRFGGKRQDG